MLKESGQEKGSLVDRLGEPPKDLVLLLRDKEPRLAKGIRAYIRALKRSGNFEQAIRDEAVREKITTKRDKAVHELNQTIRGIIETEDPLVQAESEVRAIWLMSSVNILNSDERIQNILEVLDSKETELKEQLESNLPTIRKEVESILFAYI